MGPAVGLPGPGAAATPMACGAGAALGVVLELAHLRLTHVVEFAAAWYFPGPHLAQVVNPKPVWKVPGLHGEQF